MIIKGTFPFELFTAVCTFVTADIKMNTSYMILHNTGVRGPVSLATDATSVGSGDMSAIPGVKNCVKMCYVFL